jgi:pimeloyl-ACP methyl ester carboxylesterase
MPKSSGLTTPLFEDSYIAVDRDLLHASIAGVRSALPAIVLEAGNGSILERWDLIVQHLQAHTRVLSYERAGVGSSGGSGASCAEVAARLSALLAAPSVKKNIVPPVILVGHSLGGLYARYFAATHPEKIAALVLIDTTPDDVVLPPMQVLVANVVLWGAHLVARTGIVQWWLGRHPSNDGNSEVTAAGARAMAHTKHVRAVLQELHTIPQTQQQVAVQGLPSSMPVLCISAGARPRIAQKFIDAFHSSHDRLAKAGIPPLSRHLCIETATHMGLLSDPQHAETVAGLIVDLATRISKPSGQAEDAGVPA